MNPRNIGQIPDADGVGTIGSQECGDMLKVWIKVVDEHLVDIKCKIFGCPAAIASCSMMTELAIGMHVDHAWELTDDQVAEALGGLPDNKYHCSNLAASALHKAIMNYVFKGPDKMDTVTVTILVDNSASNNLQSEHGLSMWLEYGQKRILFDTGQTNLILHNAEKLGVDLSKTDAIVVSHGHFDHTGGLASVLDIALNTNLYIYPDATAPKFSKHDSNVTMIGMSEPTREKIQILAGKEKVFWTQIPTEIFPGLFVTGRIPRETEFENVGSTFFVNESCQKTDELPDDQAIYFETKKGIVILLGCAHSGVVNTLEYVMKLTARSKIYAVIGGMHLVGSNLKRIEATIDAFRKYDVQKIVPLHCTGRRAMEKIKESFPERCTLLGAGDNIQI